MEKNAKFIDKLVSNWMICQHMRGDARQHTVDPAMLRRIRADSPEQQYTYGERDQQLAGQSFLTDIPHQFAGQSFLTDIQALISKK